MIQQLTAVGVIDMEVVVVEYILSTIGVMDMKRDFHSVSTTLKLDQEHTVMMWGYIADMVSMLHTNKLSAEHKNIYAYELCSAIQHTCS